MIAHARRLYNGVTQCHAQVSLSSIAETYSVPVSGTRFLERTRGQESCKFVPKRVSSFLSVFSRR